MQRTSLPYLKNAGILTSLLMNVSIKIQTQKISRNSIKNYCIIDVFLTTAK